MLDAGLSTSRSPSSKITSLTRGITRKEVDTNTRSVAHAGCLAVEQATGGVLHLSAHVPDALLSSPLPARCLNGKQHQWLKWKFAVRVEQV